MDRKKPIFGGPGNRGHLGEVFRNTGPNPALPNTGPSGTLNDHDQPHALHRRPDVPIGRDISEHIAVMQADDGQPGFPCNLFGTRARHTGHLGLI